MSKIETNTIDNISGSSALQIGDTNTATIGLGKSGDTITIPSGATIVNSGTATNFGFTPYGACVGAVSDQVISDSTWTKVALADEFVDTNGEFASDKYTVTTAGTYQLSAQVYENGESGTSVQWQVGIYKNGTILLRGAQTTDYAVAYTFPAAPALVPLSASDYIELFVFHNKGSNASINGTGMTGDGTYLSVLRVR